VVISVWLCVCVSRCLLLVSLCVMTRSEISSYARACACVRVHTHKLKRMGQERHKQCSTCVSMRQHTRTYVSIRRTRDASSAAKQCSHEPRKHTRSHNQHTNIIRKHRYTNEQSHAQPCIHSPHAKTERIERIVHQHTVAVIYSLCLHSACHHFPKRRYI
jgi:hypothetical protein